MSHNTGFPPVARKDAHILILGSMPGVKSLEDRQYYAHPRNAFWPIMCDLFNAPDELTYTQRIQLLNDNRIALWDVLKSCYRPGSLDSAIETESIACNDFNAFLTKHSQIKAIFFNGGKAEQLFKQHVLKQLAYFDIEYIRLPSTSPAYAAKNFNGKLSDWTVLQTYLNS